MAESVALKAYLLESSGTCGLRFTANWIKCGPEDGRAAAEVGRRRKPQLESLEGRQMLSTAASSLTPNR